MLVSVPGESLAQGLFQVIGRAGRMACRGAIHRVQAGLGTINGAPTPPRPDLNEETLELAQLRLTVNGHSAIVAAANGTTVWYPRGGSPGQRVAAVRCSRLPGVEEKASWSPDTLVQLIRRRGARGLTRSRSSGRTAARTTRPCRRARAAGRAAAGRRARLAGVSGRSRRRLRRPSGHCRLTVGGLSRRRGSTRSRAWRAWHPARPIGRRYPHPGPGVHAASGRRCRRTSVAGRRTWRCS